MVSPAGYSLEKFYLARLGADEGHLNLLGDYKSDVALGQQRPILPATRGQGISSRDIPAAEVHFFGTVHFALEIHCDAIASMIREFL